MKRRDLWIFLVLQLLAIVWAGLVFRIFESRLMAGAMAGTFFVLSGGYMVYRAWSWPDRWTSFCFYPALIHLFVISLPLVISRFLQIGAAFEEVQILGLPGPVFHRLSTSVFSVLIVTTVVDLIRTYRQPK